MNKKIRAIGAVVLVAVWAVLTALAWFGPKEDVSEAERRPLAQMPEFSADTLLSGKFMTAFEDYTLDQFPMRDRIRQVKSLFHAYVLHQKDNNGIYMADGYAAKLEYPLKEPSLKNAITRFTGLYETYLKDSGCHVVAAVVPDKGYYLAEAKGYPAMDYEKLFLEMEEKMPWAEFVDLTDCLSLADYYRTDTHWRQEKILPAAQKVAQTLGVSILPQEDYTQVPLERPFYGVYYGQAALPMEPEPLYKMESQLLSQCRVFNHETKQYGPVYDMEKARGKDPYEVYLSGAKALLTIENPNAATDRELVVFRDSFGSSLVPLLVQDYQKVTLVDIRYVASNLVGQYVDFHGQDVLFLYSTLVLNSSTTLK